MQRIAPDVAATKVGTFARLRDDELCGDLSLESFPKALAVADITNWMNLPRTASRACRSVKMKVPTPPGASGISGS
jgi:hypothetical protein